MKCLQDSKKTKIAYSSFLQNKKVVIVGPAPHIMEYQNGELIDSYDIVVRINHGYIIPEKKKKCIGSRVDILYDSMLSQKGSGITMPIDKLKNRVKWICTSNVLEKHYQDIYDFQQMIKNKILFHIIDFSFWELLVKKMKVPHSGTVAILDLLRYDIVELFITGFTFYKIKGRNRAFYYDGYHEKVKRRRPTRTSKHNPNKQFKYIREIYKKDKRIVCDEVLMKLFLEK